MEGEILEFLLRFMDLFIRQSEYIDDFKKLLKTHLLWNVLVKFLSDFCP